MGELGQTLEMPLKRPEPLVQPTKPPTPEILRPEVGITITHHLPDYPEYNWLSLEKDGGFQKMCEHLKSQGVTAQRFDARWNHITPNTDSNLNTEYVDRLSRISEIGTASGLDNILVLSSPPEWAIKLAKTDPPAFVKAFESYVDTVFSSLSAESIPPKEIQLFNELNMNNFTPEALLPNMENCMDIVRQKMQTHFEKNLPLVATLQVSTIGSHGEIPLFKKDSVGFIQKYQTFLEKFDGVKLDYYPGIWHQPNASLEKYRKNLGFLWKTWKNRNNAELDAIPKTPKDMLRVFTDMELLEQTLTAMKPLSDKGVKFGIGEIGVPSMRPFETEAMKSEHQKLQTIGVSLILSRLPPLIKKFNLTEVGIYSLMDEPTREAGIFNWGLYDKNGNPKHIEEKLDKLIARINPSARERLQEIAAIQKPLS